MNLQIIKINKNKNTKKGFVILFAVTLSALMLALALGVMNIAYKEVKFSTSAQDTNDAFFAADVGVECALLGDKNNSFPIDPGSKKNINCARSSISPQYVSVGGSNQETHYTFNILSLGSGKACSSVDVHSFIADTNNTTDSSLWGNMITDVTSKGYNLGGDGTCNSTNPNLVEREIVTTFVNNKLVTP